MIDLEKRGKDSNGRDIGVGLTGRGFGHSNDPNITHNTFFLFSKKKDSGTCVARTSRCPGWSDTRTGAASFVVVGRGVGCRVRLKSIRVFEMCKKQLARRIFKLVDDQSNHFSASGQVWEVLA